MSTFPFLELPAELRNQIYDLILAEDDRLQRICPRASDSGIEARKRLAPLAQVNRQLRAEYLPCWMTRFDVAVHVYNLEEYVRVFCRRFKCTRLRPKLITIYIPAAGGAALNVDSTHPPTNILSLIKLRQQCPSFACAFVPDPRDQWRSGSKPLIDADCRELEKLVCSSNEKFVAVIKGKKMIAVLLYPERIWPYAYSMRKYTRVAWVFSAQLGRVRVIDKLNTRYNLGEAREFGVEDVYRCNWIHFTMSIAEKRKEEKVTLESLFGGETG